MASRKRCTFCWINFRVTTRNVCSSDRLRTFSFPRSDVSENKEEEIHRHIKRKRYGYKPLEDKPFETVTKGRAWPEEIWTMKSAMEWSPDWSRQPTFWTEPTRGFRVRRGRSGGGGAVYRLSLKATQNTCIRITPKA